MKRPCLDCGRLIARGSRCPRCERRGPRQTPGRKGAARFRREVLAKTGGRCAKCGTTRNVQAHHLDPIREGGDPTDASRGVPLCAGCHAKVEAKLKRARAQGRIL